MRKASQDPNMRNITANNFNILTLIAKKDSSSDPPKGLMT